MNLDRSHGAELSAALGDKLPNLDIGRVQVYFQHDSFSTEPINRIPGSCTGFALTPHGGDVACKAAKIGPTGKMRFHHAFAENSAGKGQFPAGFSFPRHRMCV